MNYITLVLIGLVTFLCPPNIKIFDAVSQEWAGGLPETGRGINYSFKLVAPKSSDQFKIDRVWMDSLYYEVKIENQLSDLRIVQEFEKGDSIQVIFTKRWTNDDGWIKTKNSIEVPMDYKGEALVGYLWKGKRKYTTIEKFEKQKPMYYP